MYTIDAINFDRNLSSLREFYIELPEGLSSATVIVLDATKDFAIEYTEHGINRDFLTDFINVLKGVDSELIICVNYSEFAVTIMRALLTLVGFQFLPPEGFVNNFGIYISYGDPDFKFFKELEDKNDMKQFSLRLNHASLLIDYLKSIEKPVYQIIQEYLRYTGELQDVPSTDEKDLIDWLSSFSSYHHLDDKKNNKDCFPLWYLKNLSLT